MIVTETAARLALAGALWHARQVGQASALACEEWLDLTRCLDPRERVVVALHAIRGLEFEQIADWLGVSRPRADQLWRRALKKMRADPAALTGVGGHAPAAVLRAG